MASTLPEDVVFEIVLRVADVKSIGRFKCISKAWRSHLSTPRFAVSHLQIHNHNHSPENIISLSECSAIVTSFAGAGSHRYIATNGLRFEDMFLTHMFGSCHGLVLFGTWRCLFLVLLNPITQQFLKIPTLKNRYKGYVLGYDSSRNDYKVVSIQPDAVHIYSCREKTWRTLPNSSPYHYYTESSPSIFVNGRIVFWSSPIGDSLVLAAFNLVTEEIERLPLAEGIEFFSLRGLAAVGGRIAVAISCGWQASFDFWLMTEYGVLDSWTKFTMHFPGAERRYRGDKGYCFLDDDGIVFGHDERMDAYNWRSGLCRDSIAPIPVRFLCKSFTFRGSLLSPNHIAEYPQLNFY